MDDFEVVKRIGAGAEGSVYLVHRKKSTADDDNDDYEHDSWPEEMVLKQIFIGKRSLDSLKEAEFLKKLQHPHVLKYYDSFLDPAQEHLCIVTEYCPGGNLYERIELQREAEEHFTEDRIMLWVTQILFGLHYIHQQKVLHRDLKTANIFIKHNDLLCVGDMGVAAQLEHSLDMRNTFVGSPYYLSPEVCQDIPYNTKSDCWSFGCVIYELCCLTQAFKGRNLLSVVNKICSGKYEPLPDQYSPQLLALVSSLLQSDPKDRPTTSELLKHSTYIKTYIAKMEQQLQAIYQAKRRHSQISSSTDLSSLESHDSLLDPNVHSGHFLSLEPGVHVPRQAGAASGPVRSRSSSLQAAGKRHSWGDAQRRTAPEGGEFAVVGTAKDQPPGGVDEGMVSDKLPDNVVVSPTQSPSKSLNFDFQSGVQGAGVSMAQRQAMPRPMLRGASFTMASPSRSVDALPPRPKTSQPRATEGVVLPSLSPASSPSRPKRIATTTTTNTSSLFNTASQPQASSLLAESDVPQPKDTTKASAKSKAQGRPKRHGKNKRKKATKTSSARTEASSPASLSVAAQSVVASASPSTATRSSSSTSTRRSGPAKTARSRSKTTAEAKSTGSRGPPTATAERAKSRKAAAASPKSRRRGASRGRSRGRGQGRGSSKNSRQSAPRVRNAKPSSKHVPRAAAPTPGSAQTKVALTMHELEQARASLEQQTQQMIDIDNDMAPEIALPSRATANISMRAEDTFDLVEAQDHDQVARVEHAESMAQADADLAAQQTALQAAQQVEGRSAVEQETEQDSTPALDEPQHVVTFKLADMRRSVEVSAVQYADEDDDNDEQHRRLTRSESQAQTGAFLTSGPEAMEDIQDLEDGLDQLVAKKEALQDSNLNSEENAVARRSSTVERASFMAKQAYAGLKGMFASRASHGDVDGDDSFASVLAAPNLEQTSRPTAFADNLRSDRHDSDLSDNDSYLSDDESGESTLAAGSYTGSWSGSEPRTPKHSNGSVDEEMYYSDSSSQSDDYDLMQAIELARVHIESRNEDYEEEAIISDHQPISIRGATEKVFVKEFGKDVYDRIYAFYQHHPEYSNGTGEDFAPEERQALLAILDSDRLLPLCQEVRELVEFSSKHNTPSMARKMY
eukprot:TRINITY_DN10749_c0_g1_i2.p1 TRINITY_DN10749_c0_g1~~TRINITY_DN10749_c0_g1_i2.p1  ORF type:complete len:1132 (+),score=262.84 TRINITY_DN10749_c0_g1_i2:105-3500(+)